MHVFVLHQCNKGTPEANEIASVRYTLEKSREDAIEYLKENYHMSEEDALKEIGPEPTDMFGLVEYVYIQKYEVE